MMKVTEHNITEWKLTDVEISELIRLTKDQMKNADDKVSELFLWYDCGKITDYEK